MLMEDPDSKQIDYTCPYLDKCLLVQQNETKIPELIQRIRQRYCSKENVSCARRYLYEQLDSNLVPPLMLPDQHEWAKQIIEDNPRCSPPEVATS